MVFRILIHQHTCDYLYFVHKLSTALIHSRVAQAQPLRYRMNGPALLKQEDEKLPILSGKAFQNFFF